jgi:hypothetical protein
MGEGIVDAFVLLPIDGIPVAQESIREPSLAYAAG